MRRTTVMVAAGLALLGHPATGQVVDLWPGPAPGSEHWTQHERTLEHTPVGTVVLNVVAPTLTAYLPDSARATGTGVIIAPGGAFVAVTIGLEGADVARWLQRRGIAAFVLKYRVVEHRSPGIPAMDMDTAARYGIADGIRALEVVRQHAAAWNVSPDRIGVIGFSAGGMVASGMLLQQDPLRRPGFAAMIYGAPFGTMPSIPRGLPPVFLAWSRDDPVAVGPVARFRDALIAAGDRPEVHVFDTGGHGFGMRRQGTPSDHWIDDFYFWLRARGLATPPGRSFR